MGQVFELFAAEYGWSHNFILDNITPSQFNLYLEMALSRIDDDRRMREELSIATSGGDLKEYRRIRTPVRETIKRRKKKIADKAKDVVTTKEDRRVSSEGELTEDGFRTWAALAGIPIYDNLRGEKELISRPHKGH